jgi:hypothetical protein
MYINFNPEKINWEEILNSSAQEQSPIHFQLGGGSYTIFHGVPYQRGAGIGALFKSLIRFLVPLGKNVGAAIGRQGLESGSKVLSSLVEGKDLKEALKDEGRSGLQQLFQKAATKLEQKGGGRGKKRKANSRKVINRTVKAKKRKLFSKIGPPLFPSSLSRRKTAKNKSKKIPRKQLRFDALGPY